MIRNRWVRLAAVIGVAMAASAALTEL